MRIKLIAFITVLIIGTAACGQKQSKTTVGATLAVAQNPEVAQNQITEETITKDILSLPQMQFPYAAVMIVEEPTADQPYFTVKGGSDMDDHFATSFWFHVYTEPKYEIRLYDIVSDSEMTLEEWRNGNPNTGTLTETDLPFTIPPAHEFDSEEFDEEQTYWRSEYTICKNGDVVISASPSMNAICVTLAHRDKNGSFTLYKRGIDFSYGEPVEDDDAAEKYVQNAIRPNFQRINAMNKWAWIDTKTVEDITPQETTLTYYYSENGLEKIVAKLQNETVEYYFLDRYLSFIYSKSDAGEERRWYVKKGSCFRGIGDNGKKLSPDARETEYGEAYSLFSKIIVA